MRLVLKTIRTDRGYSQDEIASLCGIKRNSYNQIERGHRNPSFQLSRKIKKVLNYEKDDLFDDF